MRSSGSIEAHGISAADLVALYDAVHFGMLDYIVRHENCASLVEDVDPWDAIALYHVLARAGVFDDPLSFNRFTLIVERTLWQESFSFDANATLAEVETMLTKLSVMPFRATSM